MYRLRIRVRGRPAGRIVVSEPRVTIGSGDTAELRWLNAGLAPAHAELIERDGAVAIRALSPADSPVVIHGRPIGQEAVIVPPDTVVRLGDLEIEVAGAKSEPPPVARHRIGGMTAAATAAVALTLVVQTIILNRAATWSRRWRDELAAAERERLLLNPPRPTTPSDGPLTGAPPDDVSVVPQP
jgi:hypothetical protein